MFKEKVPTIISSSVLVCLSFLFIFILTSASAATNENFKESQDILTVPTQCSPNHPIVIAQPGTEMKDFEAILKSLPKTSNLPPLIDTLPQKDTAEASIEANLEKLRTDNPDEYYKKRADNWTKKDVANIEPITTLTPKEINLIERLVECELTGNAQELYYGKLAIANAILNRYRTDYWEFPNTIKEIVYQKNQFSPAFNGMLDKITVTELTKTVVKDALNGVMVIEPNVYYFCTLDAGGKEWFENRLEFYGHFSGHDFYSLK